MLNTISRRHFLALSVVALPAFLRSPRSDHPKPRPGIDASRVPTENELDDARDAIAAFNEVRQIPHIIDGIRCYCGCAKSDGYYSLLSCYEKPAAMAKYCDKCQGEGRYAYRLHRAGNTLDEIRAAIDERYG